MSSNNRRERELARAKRERQMARASASQRTNNAVIALIAVLVVILGGWFLLSGRSNDNAAPASSSPAASSPSSSSSCSQAPAANPSPAQFAAPKGGKVAGKWDWTLKTNCGDLVLQLDADLAPQTVSSMKFLTEQKFYDGVPCHRVTTSGLYVLQCGDPTGTGGGGPGYSIPDENLPAAGENNYPAGTLAMANAGANTGGSQFFIVYKDTTLGPNYTIFGKVLSGLDIVEQVAAAGDTNGAGDGAPAQPIGILSATIGKEAS